MNHDSNRDASETVELLRRAEGGDRQVLDDLFLLALVDHRAGRAGEARDHLRKAIGAVEKGAVSGGAAAACSPLLRAEAERVLGAPD